LSLDEVTDLIASEARILAKDRKRILLGSGFEGKIYVMEHFHIPKESYDIVVAKSFDPGWTIFLG
jgi:hypothetical protein